MSDIDDVKRLAQSKKAKADNERILQEKLQNERIQYEEQSMNDEEQSMNDLYIRLKDLKKQLKNDVKIVIKKDNSKLDVYLGISPLLGTPYKHFSFNECDDIEIEIERIKESAADMLTEGYKYELPFWVGASYQGIGAILGGLSGLGTWIIIGIAGGLWGWLLGWIAALIVGMIMMTVWPILILIAIAIYINS